MKNNIQFVVMNEKDLGLAYLGFKEGLYEVSKEAFGWNENFQHDRFFKTYNPQWFYWLEHSDKKIGYVCFSTREKEADLHVHVVIINKENQNLGYGADAMKMIGNIGESAGLNITLSALKNNLGAVKLYKKLGYEIYGEDEYFYDFIKKHHQGR